jgi:putative transposase
VQSDPVTDTDNKQNKARGPAGRALTQEQRQTLLDLLHSERFCDQAPREVYATLLSEGVYHGSVSTMYRLLRESQEQNERRNQLRHIHFVKPELLATRPNQLWSWDITKLKAATKWTYYYLYVVLDIYSRYVVGWCIAACESAQIAEQLILEACLLQNIPPGQLTLHADRGSSMTSKVVEQLLVDLGVTKTHSRPHVSNDNPYSEAQFKTLKYRPQFPERFDSLEEARIFCEAFFVWYNTAHHHSGIAMLTPEIVHTGRAIQEIARREAVLLAAYAAHPERFVNHPPRHPALPRAAWINPPAKDRAPVAEGAAELQ